MLLAKQHKSSAVCSTERRERGGKKKVKSFLSLAILTTPQKMLPHGAVHKYAPKFCLNVIS